MVTHRIVPYKSKMAKEGQYKIQKRYWYVFWYDMGFYMMKEFHPFVCDSKEQAQQLIEYWVNLEDKND